MGSGLEDAAGKWKNDAFYYDVSDSNNTRVSAWRISLARVFRAKRATLSWTRTALISGLETNRLPYTREIV
jgi:hypothetical protein